jgi:hypothetical protein
MESIIGIVVIALVASFFSLGVLVGYKWRDRISQQRRAQYLAERIKREQSAALTRTLQLESVSLNGLEREL